MRGALAFMLLALSAMTLAQEGPVIKTSLPGFFAGQFQLSVEQPWKQKTTVQATVGAVRSNLELNTSDLESLLSINTSLEAVDWVGFLVMPEIRRYLSPEAGKGFYLGAFGRVRCIRRTMQTAVTSVQRRTAVGAGVVLGGQFKISKHARGDLFVGPQIKSVTLSYGEHFVYGEEPWLPGVRFGIHLGWMP